MLNIVFLNVVFSYFVLSLLTPMLFVYNLACIILLFQVVLPLITIILLISLWRYGSFWTGPEAVYPPEGDVHTQK